MLYLCEYNQLLNIGVFMRMLQTVFKEKVAVNTSGVRNLSTSLVTRVIYKKAYGYIPTGWHVHHIDQEHTNDSPDNLIALPEDLHVQIHAEMRSNGLSYDRAYLESRIVSHKNQLRDLVAKRDRLQTELDAVIYTLQKVHGIKPPKAESWNKKNNKRKKKKQPKKKVDLVKLWL